MKGIRIELGLLILFLTACQKYPQYHRDPDAWPDSPESSASQSSPQGFKDESTKNNYYADKDSHSSSGRKSAAQMKEILSQPKKRVMVLNFWNDTPVKTDTLGVFVAEELKRGLSLTHRAIVPSDAQSDLGTDDLVDGDRIKVAQLVREGRRLGVSVVIIGRVKKISFRQTGEDVGLFPQKQSFATVELETKVFDVQMGHELMASVRSGEASDGTSEMGKTELTQAAAREAIAGFIPDLMKALDKLVWQGRIAKLVGLKVYINAGKASGLNTGDILRVLTPGEDIYDPASGAYLGRADGQLKGTLEVMDFLGPDGAVTQIHTGGNFREGDSVQLY